MKKNMNMTKKDATVDLRTASERKRAERRDKVCRMFAEYHRRWPEAKPYRLMGAVALEMGLSVQGVAKILRAGGLYSPRRERQAATAATAD